MNYEKSGYLLENYKLFHLEDSLERDFAFHYHDFHKIIWFVKGQVEYHIEGKAYSLKPYDILLVRKGEIHKPVVDFHTPYERYVLYISEEFLHEHAGTDFDLNDCFVMARKEQSSVVRLDATASNQIFQILQALEENQGKKAYAGELYGNILFLEFMIQLNRLCMENANVFHKSARFDKKIVELVQYINSHLAEELTVETLSGKFYISKYHMMRKFKEETGYSLHQYILEKRILAAREQILAGTPATTACLECGFKDYSTFTRAFKSKLQMLPSEVNHIVL